MTMTDKEVEAGLSLLHMMQPAGVVSPPAATSRTTSSTVSNRQPLHDNAGQHERAHAALMRIVASQADALALSLASGSSSSNDPVYSSSNIVNNNNSSNTGSSANHNNTDKRFLKRTTQLTSLSRELNLDDLRVHFDKPIVDVARMFGICTTFLKKICRRLGIKRWPHRHIRSLARTIAMLQLAEAAATTPSDRRKLAAQIAQLEATKRDVLANPDADNKLKRVKTCSGVGSGKAKRCTSVVGTAFGAGSAGSNVSAGPNISADVSHKIESGSGDDVEMDASYANGNDANDIVMVEPIAAASASSSMTETSASATTVSVVSADAQTLHSLHVVGATLPLEIAPSKATGAMTSMATPRDAAATDDAMDDSDSVSISAFVDTTSSRAVTSVETSTPLAVVAMPIAQPQSPSSSSVSTSSIATNASDTASSKPSELTSSDKISPSHRKLLVVSGAGNKLYHAADGASSSSPLLQLRSASLESLQVDDANASEQ